MSNCEVNITRIEGDWSKSIKGYQKEITRFCHAIKNEKIISVVLADDKFVQELNHQFRGKNKPTNVLSFNGGGDELGDIVLAYETIKQEAKEQKKSFTSHTAHLIIHGCLHLLGFDHEADKDAEKMERKEITILKELGFDNPYEVKK